jgi:hypothetical protein
VTGESLDLIKSVEMGVHFLPVHAEGLGSEHVPKFGDRSEPSSKVRRQNGQFVLSLNGLVVVLRLGRPLKGDDTITDVNAALRSDLKVALHYVPQIGILIKRRPTLLLKGTQAIQAFAPFVSATLDTAEFGHLARAW